MREARNNLRTSRSGKRLTVWLTHALDARAAALLSETVTQSARSARITQLIVRLDTEVRGLDAEAEFTRVQNTIAGLGLRSVYLSECLLQRGFARKVIRSAGDTNAKVVHSKDAAEEWLGGRPWHDETSSPGNGTMWVLKDIQSRMSRLK